MAQADTDAGHPAGLPSITAERDYTALAPIAECTLPAAIAFKKPGHDTRVMRFAVDPAGMS